MPEDGQDRYSIAAQEDRSAPRTRRAIPVALHAAGAAGQGFSTVLRDLSISGFSAPLSGALDPGTPCSLTVPGLHSLRARVVWWNKGLVGCAFDDLLNPAICDDLLDHWRGAGCFDDEI
ncbi:PilZ domain-containing protein [Novosphingobium album (ex Liu et al. 2023)]|uniref:PilZ domain-containing protein n=1 Tax=Novosphingobium album (ex Liu et al. 2023) TaxID=3031130 RepID=A0ABT5WRS5_9SPHN|nr:PilZ domain-containing protein [Novosphingobium album (ex Liu et al. 2023)]MDE8652741.1 PilZ domain-containing protein [Novosphingobium album (ex Liu et al. 2023)]